MCFLPIGNDSLLLSQASRDAERLYVCGVRDVVPIVGESGDYYKVALPGGEFAFVLKSAGKLAEIGTANVTEPLGYVRSIDGYTAEVVLVQPSGERETLYTLKPEDRLPVVEERDRYYVVQLADGMRGWVHKAHGLLTLSPSSIPQKSGVGLASVLGIAALIGVAAIGGIINAATEDSDVRKMRRAVSDALRDRGY